MKSSSGRSSTPAEKNGRGEATGRVARIFRVAVRRLAARLPGTRLPREMVREREMRESESRRRAHHKDDAPPKRYGERRRTDNKTVVHGRDGWRTGFTIWWGKRGVLMPPRQQLLQPHHPTAAADTVPDFYTRTRTRAAHTQQQTIASLFSFFISFFFSVSLGPDDRLARSPGFPHPLILVLSLFRSDWRRARTRGASRSVSLAPLRRPPSVCAERSAAFS